MVTDAIRPAGSGNRKVEVNEPWALRYWTRELGVTERDLREAVEVVGPLLPDVKRILTRQPRTATQNP